MKIKGSNSFCFRNSRNDEHAKAFLVGNSLDMFQGPITINPDIVPIEKKPEDFALFPYRHVSATIVGGGSWKATDFSDEKVLKQLIPLLEGKPVFTNHNLSVGNEVGFVGDLKWKKAYTNSQGEKIPAGIDGPIVIDTVTQGKLARDMSPPNPIVRHASVTVKYDWEASHEFEYDDDFWWKLGEIGADGKMIRRIATKMTGAYETSLVWLGADPFAGVLDEKGEVQFVDKGGVVELSADNPLLLDLFKNKGLFVEKGTFYNTENKFSFNKTEKTEDTMPGLEKLASKLGKTVDDLTPEFLDTLEFVTAEEKTSFGSATVSLKTAQQELELSKTEVTTLQAEGVTAKAEIAQLKTDNAALDVKAKKSDEQFAERIKYGVEVYKKTTDKPDDNIIKDIEATVDFELLESKIKLHGGEALNSFGGTCDDCGKTNISFRSSKSTAPSGVEDKNIMSDAEMIRRNPNLLND